MRLLKIIFCIVVLACFVAPAADAQFFSVCRDGSEDELVVDIITHSEHAWRMEKKITEYYYHQGKLHNELKKPIIDDVQNFLRRIEEKKSTSSAVLFHAVDSERPNLCTWLITPNSIVPHITSVPEKEFIQKLHSEVLDALDVTRMAKGRAPIRRGVKQAQLEAKHSQLSEKEALQQMRDLLIPEPIANALHSEHIDTLVVVPIFGIGTYPFSAFEFQNSYLVDHMSVTIAPSFRIFTKDHKMAQKRNFSEPIIIGDPCDESKCYDDPKWKFMPLNGARKEAIEVAKKFANTEALVGLDATRNRVQNILKDRSNTGLVYIATHGIADEKDPNDKSFLLLSDNRWTARQIYDDTKEAQLKSGFLVVMSACQTGLGKVFDVGNTGLTRAWHSAGASNVVMSLWNVDDDATRLLMTKFIEFAKEKPPDIALQRAMQEARKNDKYSRPAYWAGFNVFGSPEINR